MSGRGGEEGTAEGSRQTPPMHAIRSNVLYTHMYSAHDTACAWIDGHVTTRMRVSIALRHKNVPGGALVCGWRLTSAQWRRRPPGRQPVETIAASDPPSVLC